MIFLFFVLFKLPVSKIQTKYYLIFVLNWTILSFKYLMIKGGGGGCQMITPDHTGGGGGGFSRGLKYDHEILEQPLNKQPPPELFVLLVVVVLDDITL